jgi:microcystin-dependent protein
MSELIIPQNIVVAWSGAINEIPAGWRLCDGQNGTPDLRNRFIIGAGSSYAFNNTGGSANAIIVSHTHTVTGISTNDGHLHNTSAFSSATVAGGGSNWSTNQTGGGASNPQAEIGGAHSHSISVTATGASATNANLPPYYALAFIMKGPN